MSQWRPAEDAYVQCAPAAAPRPDLAGEEERNGGHREDDANNGEGIAEGDDESLALDDIADRDDRLMLRRGGIRDAVREEIARQIGDALPHLVAIERH
jgi:hypothetical protein